MDEDMLTIPQAAALIGMDRSVVFRAVQAGQIAGHQVSAKLWLVKRDDVQAFALTRPAGEKRGRKKATPTEEQP